MIAHGVGGKKLHLRNERLLLKLQVRDGEHIFKWHDHLHPNGIARKL